MLRFGGSGNDVLVYEFGSTKCPEPASNRNCLNETTWRNLLEFTRAANARIIFGICEPKWTGCGAPEQGPHCGSDRKQPCTPCPPWDASNAREILEWTIAQGLDDLIYGLELGNEVDGMYSGAQQAGNLQTLYNLTLELWQDASKRPVLLGPDAAHQDAVQTAPPFPTPRDAYVYEFFKEAGRLQLPIKGATLHKYIETDTQRDTNASVLDETTVRFRAFQEQVNGGWAASGNTKVCYTGHLPPCHYSACNSNQSSWHTGPRSSVLGWGGRPAQRWRPAMQPYLHALGYVRRLSVVHRCSSKCCKARVRSILQARLHWRGLRPSGLLNRSSLARFLERAPVDTAHYFVGAQRDGSSNPAWIGR